MPTHICARVVLALQAVVYLLWPPVIWAATITLDQSLGKVTVLVWAMVLVLSTVSALAALLNRLKQSVPPRLGFFVSSHMLGSWLSGVLMFLIGEAFDIHDFVEVVIIVVGSYGGANLIDRWAVSLANRVANETEGNKPSGPA